MTTRLCGIDFRDGKAPGARYISGRTVFDETFLNGRLLTRYWNTNGQVWPEMHLEHLQWAPDQPADTFQLAVNNQDLAGGFTWDSAALKPAPSTWRPRRNAKGKLLPVVHGAISLRHKDAGIVVKVHTRLDGGPFVIRWLEVSNLNDKSVGITAVSPFSGLLWSHRFDEHLPPGCASPFEAVYTHRFEWGQEGDFWFEALPAGRKAVDGGKKGRSGWGRPAFWARNLCNGQTFVCELAWSGNYQFAFDCRLKENPGHNLSHPQWRAAELYFQMGLSAVHPVLRVLDPGETLTTPAVHMALFAADSDAIVQATHDHVRQVVMPEQLPGRHVEVEANHRGYLCDRENVPDILKDVDVATAVGAEMYVIDAGWYGREPNRWWNNAGDWFEGVWMKAGGGLKAVSDYVHRKGMKFGLWVEIEAIAAHSKLREEHPDWVLKEDAPAGGSINGRALDLTKPEAAAFAESEIARLIEQYRLDMYRLDHNHILRPSPNPKYESFKEDLIWRYYESLYGIFDRLRARFPKVVFQNCAGGGGRLDWGILARFHNTELSDWMRLPRGLKILNGVTMSLPPEILLRTFGTEVGEHALDGDIDAQLRLCACRPIFRGIAPSLGELTPYLRERIGHFMDVYRRFIRPVMIEGRVFHHTPFLPLFEHAPWCVLEYAKTDRSAAIALVFRTSCAAEGPEPDVYVLRMRGLDPVQGYEVTLDNQSLRFTASGAELAQHGLRVRSSQPQSSEMVLCRRIRRRSRKPE